MAYGLPQGGQRIIVADRASKVMGREIVIPGLRANPDQLPVPNMYDVEFSRQLRQGYTEVNTPSWDLNTTVKGHLTFSMAANQSRRGIFWFSPPAPFTVTTKVAGMLVFPSTGNSTQQFGLAISDSTPDTTNMTYIQFATNGDGTINCIFQAVINGSGTNSPTTQGYGIVRPHYQRIIVASASSVTCQFSFDGLLWTTLASGNPSFTPASFGLQGFTSTTVTGAPIKFAMPWIRVTTP